MDFFPLPIKSSGGRRWTLKPSGGAEKMEKQEPGRVEKNWWRLVTNGETLEEAGMLTRRLTRRPPGNHWLMLARWPTKEQRQVFAVRQQETTVWCQPGKLTWKFAESPTRNRWLVSAMPQNKEQKWLRLNQGAGVSQAVDRGTGVGPATDRGPGTVVGWAVNPGPKIVVGQAADPGPGKGEDWAANQRTGVRGLALGRWAAARMSTWAVKKQAVASQQTAEQHRGTISVGARLPCQSWLIG